MTNKNRLAEIQEQNKQGQYSADSYEYKDIVWLIARVKKLEAALETIDKDLEIIGSTPTERKYLAIIAEALDDK